jgi:hypothetical protein
MFGGKKRGASSFDREYFRKTANTSAGGNSFEQFANKKVLAPVVEEETQVGSPSVVPLPLIDESVPSLIEAQGDTELYGYQYDATLNDPQAAPELQRSASQNNFDPDPSAPSILPPGGPFNVNVNFGRDRKKRKETPAEFYDVGTHVFKRSNNAESTRDMYFIRMVAGGLGKKFMELIEVINSYSDSAIEAQLQARENQYLQQINSDKTVSLQDYKVYSNKIDAARLERQAKTNNTTTSKYKYSDLLLKAWSGAMEMVKLMIVGGESQDTDKLYVRLIENDTFLNALADYVVYKISTRNRGALITGKTKYNYANEESQEDVYLEQIMRPLHHNFGILKPDLVEDYFPST